MKIKQIILLFASFSAVAPALSQKPLTARCEERVECCDTADPDDLKSSRYDDSRLDSIPYLMEHVRNREPRAYESLARRYRFGLGVEKSITNAMIYYDKAGTKEREWAENVYTSNPSDELGFMNHLMEELDKNRMTIEEALTLLDSYPEPLPSWAVCMKKIFDNRNVGDIESYIVSSIDLNNTTADELVASIACLRILKPDTPPFISRPSSPEFMAKLSLAADKIPMLYTIAGDKYLALYEDCPKDEQALRNSFEMYHKAYLHGLLDAGGAVEILDYRDNNQLYEGFPFTREELAHLDGFYSKEYRIHYKSACFVEDEAVEEVKDDESPVVLESEAYR